MTEPTITLSATFPDRESLNQFDRHLIEVDEAVEVDIDFVTNTVRWQIPLRTLVEKFYLVSYEAVKEVDSRAWLTFGFNEANHIAHAVEPWELHLSRWED